MNIGTTQSDGIVSYPVAMRTAPTALEQSGTASDYAVFAHNAVISNNAVPAFMDATISTATIRHTVASGLTAGDAALLGGTGYLAWSAEL